MTDGTTNPGSDEAIAQGCKCPILDNARGKGSGYVNSEGSPQFWINADCPLHGTPEAKQGTGIMRALCKAVGAE